MAEERTVLLKVELDAGQLKKTAREAETELAKLTPQLKKLKDEGKQNTLEYKTLQVEIQKYNKQLGDSAKAIQAAQNSQKQSTGSLKEMRQELADAKVAFQNLSQEARESEAGQEMARQMNELKTAITDVEKSFGTFTGDVGNYEGALKKALAEQNKFAGDLKGLPVDATIEDIKKLSGDMEHLGQDIIVEVSGSISKMEDRLYELALAGDTTSDEFVKLQRQTAEYKKIILEVDASIDNLAESGGALGAALQLGQGVVAGYQAITGATALFGAESEQLLEILTKLEAAQALLSSLEAAQLALRRSAIPITQAQTQAQKLLTLAIGEGSKASKVFRGALLATGIGALILLVTELVTNFEKVKEAFGGTAIKQEALNASMTKGLETVSKELSAADKLKKQLNDETLTREQKIEAVKELQREYPNLLSNIDAESASIEETNKALELNVKLLRLKAQQDALVELRAEEFTTQLKAQADAMTGNNIGFTETAQAVIENTSVWDIFTGKVTDLEKAQKNVAAAQKIANANTKEELKESQKKINAYDEIDKSIQKQIDSLIEQGAVGEDEINKAKELEDKRKEASKLREDEMKKALELARQISDLTLNNQKLSLDNERKALEAHYTFLESIAGENADELLKLAEQKNIDINALEQKERDASIASLEEKYRREIEAAKGNKDLITQIETEKQLELDAINLDYNNKVSQRGIELINKQTELGDARVEATKQATSQIEMIEAELALIGAETIEDQKTAWQNLQDVRVSQLEATRDAELQNENLTSQERIRITKETELEITRIKEEEFQARQEKLDPIIKENIAKEATYALSSAQQLSDALFQIKQNQLQKELNAVQEKYEQESSLLKDQLDANIISQAEYDAKKSALDSQAQAKEKKIKEEQFKSQKTSQLINAAINTAVAVTAALGIPGAGIALAAVSAALGAAQIAIIASQPTPKFEKGGNPIKSGTFGGKSHAGGGTRGVFDDGTQIEVEKDENFYILNKRSSDMINRLSHLNQMGGGIPLAKHGAVMKFATGGAFASQSTASADNRYNQQNAIAEYISNMPRPVVLVEDINGAQGTLADVESRASF